MPGPKLTGCSSAIRKTGILQSEGLSTVATWFCELDEQAKSFDRGSPLKAHHKRFRFTWGWAASCCFAWFSLGCGEEMTFVLGAGGREIAQYTYSYYHGGYDQLGLCKFVPAENRCTRVTLLIPGTEHCATPDGPCFDVGRGGRFFASDCAETRSPTQAVARIDKVTGSYRSKGTGNIERVDLSIGFKDGSTDRFLAEDVDRGDCPRF